MVIASSTVWLSLILIGRCYTQVLNEIFQKAEVRLWRFLSYLGDAGAQNCVVSISPVVNPKRAGDGDRAPPVRQRRGGNVTRVAALPLSTTTGMVGAREEGNDECEDDSGVL